MEKLPTKKELQIITDLTIVKNKIEKDKRNSELYSKFERCVLNRIKELPEGYCKQSEHKSRVLYDCHYLLSFKSKTPSLRIEEINNGMTCRDFMIFSEKFNKNIVSDLKISYIGRQEYDECNVAVSWE
jgi:hypothetical protein